MVVVVVGSTGPWPPAISPVISPLIFSSPYIYITNLEQYIVHVQNTSYHCPEWARMPYILWSSLDFVEAWALVIVRIIKWGFEGRQNHWRFNNYSR